MAFGAGACAKQWSKEAKREASVIRRYAKPFMLIALGVYVTYLMTYITQDQAIVMAVGFCLAYAYSIGRLQRSKVQAARAAASRREHGAKGEVAMGWHLFPLMLSKSYGVIHDRLIFKDSDANWDHFVVTPSGIKMIDTKNYSGKAKWEVEGADLIYNNASIRPKIKMAVDAQARVRQVVRSLEKELGKKIPVEPCLAIYPHMRLKHGGFMSAKNVDGVLVMRFREVRGWCTKGEHLFSSREIKLIKKHLRAKFPPATKGKR